MNYAQVKNGQVIATFLDVPYALGNVVGFSGIPASERQSLGFYPVNDARPLLATRFHRHINNRFTFTGSMVRREANVELMPIEQIRETLKSEVNQLRDEKMGDGIEFLGHTFDSDPRSLQNLTATVAAIAAGIPLPLGIITWRTADNQNVVFTAAELIELAGMMLARMNAIYQASWQIKAAIDAAENPETFDISLGWPA